ncbi:unnamed protein product, partial [Brenthis ino]
MGETCSYLTPIDAKNQIPHCYYCAIKKTYEVLDHDLIICLATRYHGSMKLLGRGVQSGASAGGAGAYHRPALEARTTNTPIRRGLGYWLSL